MATDWKKVLHANGAGVKVSEGNRVDFLVDGWNAYEAMYDAIATTFKQDDSYYIYLLAWWLDDEFPLLPNDPESTFERLVTRAAVEFGVQVRMMVWANPLAGIPGMLTWPLARSELLPQQLAQLVRYSALPKAGFILDEETQPSFTQSHHQKVLLVKGAKGLVGFCGGMDIAIDRVMEQSLHADSPFHDVHCRIEGDATCDLVDVFIQRWRAHPRSSVLDSARGELRCLADRAPVKGRKPAGEQSVGIGRTINIKKGGTWYAGELSVATVCREAIRAARRFIYIEDQYLVNLEAAQLLHEALPRIQHLTILMPQDVELVLCTEYRAAFYELLTQDRRTAHKVRIFHRREGRHQYVHSKCWIIDDELAIVGSANCNRRGWNGDSEVVAAIFDKPSSAKSPPFAQRLRMRLWAEHTDRMVYDGLDTASWQRAAREGRVRDYDPTAYSMLAAGKDTYALNLATKFGRTRLDIWDVLSDPMPKPFPMQQELREVRKKF